MPIHRAGSDVAADLESPRAFRAKPLENILFLLLVLFFLVGSFFSHKKGLGGLRLACGTSGLAGTLGEQQPLSTRGGARRAFSVRVNSHLKFYYSHYKADVAETCCKPGT